jgi:iron complex outermembrane receptor protein
VQIGTYRVTSPAAQFYGAVPLKPEKSTNLSAGIVLTPIARLLVTVDGYSIKVKDRIGISQQFTVTQADIDAQPALAYVGLGGTVQYFTNGFDTTTKGVDVVGTYPFDMGVAGRLDTTVAYNYNKTTVDSYNPNVINQARIIDIEHYAPNDRVNIGLNWTIDKLYATVRQNYYGTYRDENDYPGQLFSSSWTTDLEVGYHLPHGITAAVGGDNIFNEMPDVVCPAPGVCTNGAVISPLTGGLGDGERYPRTGGPYGYNGAFFYARIGAKF